MLKKAATIFLLLIGSCIQLSQAQTNCFHYFQTPNKEHNDTIAYLLMDCNYYIFPDLIGVKKYKDDSAFQVMFTEKYSAYGMKEFSFINNDSTSTNLVVMSDEHSVIIIFRGSEIKGGLRTFRKDWLLTDARCKMMMVDNFNNSYVHTGFWNSYLSVRDTLINTLLAYQTTNKKIFITGHSLGGALAILAAADLSQHNMKPFSVYTFANPRTGTTGFADFYTSLNIPTFRYVNENDLVPMLPPVKAFHRINCPSPAKDCGKYQHIGTIYNIHKDGKVFGDDAELKVPCKSYKLGKIKRHNVFEYCNKIYKSCFPTNDSLGYLPKPPCK